MTGFSSSAPMEFVSVAKRGFPNLGSDVPGHPTHFLFGGHVSTIVIRSNQVCTGCGRRLPKGSRVTAWSCWDDGTNVKARFCSDCSGVIYGCKAHGRVFVYAGDERIVERMCRRCDSFPTCERVEWLRGPHDGWFFGDLGGVNESSTDKERHPDVRPHCV